MCLCCHVCSLKSMRRTSCSSVLTQVAYADQSLLSFDNGELWINNSAVVYYPSGIYIINLGKTWEKLQLAARVIVAIENPQDIIVQSARPYGQRAVLKFAQYTGAHAIAGRHTPGTFTNQLQTSFSEPRLLILTDPRTDHQVKKLISVEGKTLLIKSMFGWLVRFVAGSWRSIAGWFVWEKNTVPAGNLRSFTTSHSQTNRLRDAAVWWHILPAATVVHECELLFCIADVLHSWI